MKNGPTRFEFFLTKIETLLQQAVKENNPALWLYSNDVRTPLFMLEALSRLYANLHNKKKFSKLKEYFKLLEDGMGAIDYYDNYAKMFLAHATVPVHIREYMQAQAREKIQHINDILISDGWIGEKPVRIKKMKAKLQEADWLDAKEEAKAIKRFYENEITEIKLFVKNTGKKFTEMETEVHELRRDLRWLSIYPQALQGMIQLTDSGTKDTNTEKYLVPEIVHSKYNVMPDAGSNEWFVMMDKNYFYALSWMIAETGKLKDDGLQFFAVAEALQQTEGMRAEDAKNKSFEILGADKDSIEKILARAISITAQFMQEQNLDKMIYGVAQIKKARTE